MKWTGGNWMKTISEFLNLRISPGPAYVLLRKLQVTQQGLVLV